MDALRKAIRDVEVAVELGAWKLCCSRLQQALEAVVRSRDFRLLWSRVGPALLHMLAVLLKKTGDVQVNARRAF